MSWTFVLRATEMRAFRECRRAWDLGARVRRDLVPRLPVAPFDFAHAVHAGLAVYYFPAMDDWNRSIVRPLALKGFHRTMQEGRADYARSQPLDQGVLAAWQRYSRLGELILQRFFAFAASFDDFDSILADEDLWVPVPDPDEPSRDLGTPDGRPVRYLCRLDQLIADGDDEWWVVDHRLAHGRWAADPELLEDADGVRTLWALEIAYPQVYVAGTVFNELLVTAQDEADPGAIDPASLDVPPDGAELDRRDMSAGSRHANLRRGLLTPEERVLAAAADRPDEIVHRESDGYVRRTWVRRGHGQIHTVGLGIAEEALEMLAPHVAVPPAPLASKCARCPFLRPCVVMEEGRDAASILTAQYRLRSAEEFEEAGIRSAARRERNRAFLDAHRARTQ